MAFLPCHAGGILVFHLCFLRLPLALAQTSLRGAQPLLLRRAGLTLVRRLAPGKLTLIQSIARFAPVFLPRLACFALLVFQALVRLVPALLV